MRKRRMLHKSFLSWFRHWLLLDCYFSVFFSSSSHKMVGVKGTPIKVDVKDVSPAWKVLQMVSFYINHFMHFKCYGFAYSRSWRNKKKRWKRARNPEKIRHRIPLLRRKWFVRLVNWIIRIESYNSDFVPLVRVPKSVRDWVLIEKCNS